MSKLLFTGFSLNRYTATDQDTLKEYTIETDDLSGFRQRNGLGYDMTNKIIDCDFFLYDGDTIRFTAINSVSKNPNAVSKL